MGVRPLVARVVRGGPWAHPYRVLDRGGIRPHAADVLGAFEETPWIGYVFGTFLGLILLGALIMWIVFGIRDLYERRDIGPFTKTLWLLAFVLSAGLILIVYGAVRWKRTGGW